MNAFTTWIDKHARGLAIGRRFVPQLVEHKAGLLIVAATGLGVALLEIARPWPIQWIVDGALDPLGDPIFEKSTMIWVGMGAALLFAGLKALLEYLGALRLAEVGHLVTRALRNLIFGKLTQLPLTFHAKHKSGDLLMRLMGDVPMLRTMLVDSAVEVFSKLVVIFGTVGMMFWIDPLLTLAVLAIVPVLALVLRLWSQRITIAVRKARRKEGVMADFLHEAVAGVSVLQSLGQDGETSRRFAKRNRTSARASLKATRLSASMSATVETTLGVVMAVTLGLGGLRVLAAQQAGDASGLTTGELIVFLSYVRGLLKPIRAASRNADKIAKGTACGERILEVLDAEVTLTSKPDAPPPPAHPQVLAFEDVGFAYRKGRSVLEHLDLRLRRGELTGLFGASGAGKSTLVSLALRLADPTSGRVTLDGVDLRDVDLVALRQSFGLCLQDSLLFGESLRDNLMLGDVTADEARLLAACREAAADEIVAALPNGLDTVLDTGGGGLSGGQRRRLCLARTLLRDPALLLVDEPFAGLDRDAVLRTRAALAKRAETSLVLVICHEVEHLEEFDRIVVLDGGRIVADGPHAELLETSAAYRRLVRPESHGVQPAGREILS